MSKFEVEGRSGPTGEMVESGGTAAVSAFVRERHELETGMMLARARPRNEAECEARILDACSRPRFAETALYRFPRSGKSVQGPSVNLVREIKRLWGNITSGFRVISMTETEVHVEGFAYDLESNTSQKQEGRFSRRIQRKIDRNGPARWIVITDERDLRELINKHGATAERNCVLMLLPSYIKEAAERACMETLRKVNDGELKVSRAETLRTLERSFIAEGVKREDIEAKIGKPLERITADELTDLRQIYQAIRDGVASADESFPRPKPEAAKSKKGPKPQTEAAQEVMEAIKRRKGEAAEDVESGEEASEPAEDVSAADFVAQTKADEEPAPEHYDEVPF